MNARISEVLADQANLLPKQFIDYDFLPTPFSAFDIVMIFVGTMCNRFSDSTPGLSNLDLLTTLKSIYPDDEDVWNIFNQLQWINDPGAPTTVPTETDLAKNESQKNKAKVPGKSKHRHLASLPNLPLTNTDTVREEKNPLASFGLNALFEPPTSSNLWMLGKKKTHDWGSIFINGPQFGWYIPGYVYEIGLHSLLSPSDRSDWKATQKASATA